MKEVLHHESTYLLRFDRGEEVLEKLQQFCAVQKIHAGSFWGIGAAKGVTLADYNLEKKEYETVDHGEMLEIASLTGNVALDGGKIMLHAHGVFSNLEKIYAGHVMKLVVGVNCEITLTAFPGEMRREYNEEIGLKLLV